MEELLLLFPKFLLLVLLFFDVHLLKPYLVILPLELLDLLYLVCDDPALIHGQPREVHIRVIH